MNCCAPSFCSMSRQRSERGKGAAKLSVRRNAMQFEEHGMASPFPEAPPESKHDKSRSLPPDMRQLIVDLKAEHPSFRPNEMATICFLRLAEDPLPIPSSVCSLTAHFPLLLHVGFLLTHRLTRHLSAEKSLSFYTRKDGQSQRLQPTCKPPAIPSMIFCAALLPRDTQDLMINPVRHITQRVR